MQELGSLQTILTHLGTIDYKERAGTSPALTLIHLIATCQRPSRNLKTYQRRPRHMNVEDWHRVKMTSIDRIQDRKREISDLTYFRRVHLLPAGKEPHKEKSLDT